MSNGASTPGQQNAQSQPSANQLMERLLGQLRGNPLVAVMIGGAAFIAIVVALLMWARAPEYRVLYSNLSEADGGSIINELDSRGIPYRFSDGGQALLVPGGQVHNLRLQLAEQGLPRGGNVGFELMDSQAFGISQFAEQVNFQRGLEGELSRSIESLGPVSRARVHLAMARSSVFVRDREPAKASVVVTLQPGRVIGDGQVSAIVHMVSSSVPDLATEDVTVVDQNGRLLSMPSANGRGLDGTQLDYVAEVERSYQQRIENILTPILGQQSVRAQVAAQIDFSRREETSERYGPNQPPNEAAVRSRQSSLNFNAGDDLAAGIPGALSNTPPGAALSPINLTLGEDEDGDAEGDPAQAGETPLQAINNLRQDDVVNYEVDRSVEHIQHRLGRIERLSAAVVVDYREERDEDGVWQRVPLSDAEVAQLERLIRQAMGFSQARGDEIEVVNSPFTREPEEGELLEWWQSPEIHSLALTFGRYLLVALGILLGYLLILRPLIKRYTQQPVLTTATAGGPGSALQVRVGDDEQESAESDGSQTDRDVQPYTKPKRKRKSSAYEDHLAELRELAQEDPRMIAMIVRSWMNKE
ncbi:flagellar M-ring protein FliF [Halomonas campisalis]|uniref:Flagellar M-ring protein n=1 Tax=Billgrantia campisalis TaxID=74661 RepID=A0ABS9P3D7_9GAMM|nr:flagellar basal-body MS-ring/collar protein FliF [Halomonas campisalis]MCG6656244.1 flagellar M-ring protein FliF [Halomonas campisalis]MDR5861431.1 flagellar basal-body MS-ring/collar protein FliF [Halomonas campisalis]